MRHATSGSLLREDVCLVIVLTIELADMAGYGRSWRQRPPSPTILPKRVAEPIAP